MRSDDVWSLSHVVMSCRPPAVRVILCSPHAVILCYSTLPMPAPLCPCQLTNTDYPEGRAPKEQVGRIIFEKNLPRGSVLKLRHCPGQVLKEVSGGTAMSCPVQIRPTLTLGAVQNSHGRRGDARHPISAATHTDGRCGGSNVAVNSVFLMRRETHKNIQNFFPEKNQVELAMLEGKKNLDFFRDFRGAQASKYGGQMRG